MSRLVLAVIISILSVPHANALPSRSECIVKIVFETPHYEMLSVEKLNGISDFISSGIVRSGQIEIIGGQRIHRRDEQTAEVFLQYTQSCNQRFSLADKALLKGEFSENSAISYGVSRQDVTPGFDTIALNGPYWRD